PDLVRSAKTGLPFDLLRGEAPALYLGPDELLQTIVIIIDEAKSCLAAYCAMKNPSRADQETIAGHAIRLAKLDLMLRALVLEPTFRDAEPEDIDDLLAMLAIVPTEKLIDEKAMYLNPNFTYSLKSKQGADTDLIIGDMMVDVKSSKMDIVEVHSLD